MVRRRSVAILVVLVIALSAGCATAPPAPTSAPEQTPYQKAQLRYVYLEGLYAAQLHDTTNMGAMGEAGKLTLEQVRIYRIKKQTLIKVKAALEAYDAILLDGGVPSASRDEEIMNMLNQVASMAGGGGQ